MMDVYMHVYIHMCIYIYICNIIIPLAILPSALTSPLSSTGVHWNDCLRKWTVVPGRDARRRKEKDGKGNGKVTEKGTEK